MIFPSQPPTPGWRPRRSSPKIASSLWPSHSPLYAGRNISGNFAHSGKLPILSLTRRVNSGVHLWSNPILEMTPPRRSSSACGFSFPVLTIPSTIGRFFLPHPSCLFASKLESVIHWRTSRQCHPMQRTSHLSPPICRPCQPASPDVVSQSVSASTVMIPFQALEDLPPFFP